MHILLIRQFHIHFDPIWILDNLSTNFYNPFPILIGRFLTKVDIIGFFKADKSAKIKVGWGKKQKDDAETFKILDFLVRLLFALHACRLFARRYIRMFTRTETKINDIWFEFPRNEPWSLKDIWNFASTQDFKVQTTKSRTSKTRRFFYKFYSAINILIFVLILNSFCIASIDLKAASQDSWCKTILTIRRHKLYLYYNWLNNDFHILMANYFPDIWFNCRRKLFDTSARFQSPLNRKPICATPVHVRPVVILTTLRHCNYRL